MSFAGTRIHFLIVLVAAMLASSVLLLTLGHRQGPRGGSDISYSTTMTSKAHGKPGWTGLRSAAPDDAG